MRSSNLPLTKRSCRADKDRTEIIGFEVIPLAYLPGNATRIKVKAAGPLKEE